MTIAMAVLSFLGGVLPLVTRTFKSSNVSSLFRNYL